MLISQLLALTERALRVDVRSYHSHGLRLLVGLSIILFLPFVGLNPAGVPGQTLLWCILLGNAVLISVVVPLYFGNGITEEKEEQTLPLLLLADIRPLALLTGKFAPRIFTVMFVLAAQLPFTLLSITLGGVVHQQLLAGYVTLAAYMWGLAGISLLASVICRRTSSAMVLLVILLTAYHFGPMFLMLADESFGGGSGTSLPGQAATAILLTNPFYRLSEILDSSFQAGPAEWLQSPAVWGPFGLGCLSLGLGWLAFNLFNRTLDAEPVLQKRVAFTRNSLRAWQSAVMWKDYQLIAGGAPWVVARLLFYGGVGLIAFAGSLASGDRMFQAAGLASILSLGILSFELQVLLASTFTFEIQDKTWTTLASLPYSIAQLAWSKVAGTLLGCWPGAAWSGLFGLFWLLSFPWSSSASSADEWLVAACVVPASVLYTVVYLHLVVMASLWTRNRWAGLALAFFLQYLGTCMVLYPLMLVPFFVYMATQSEFLTVIASIVTYGGVAAALVAGFQIAIHGELSRQRNA